MDTTNALRGTLRPVLADRNARLCLATVLVSGFGSTALWLTAGIWVKDRTGSDSLAALCAFALWAPQLAGPLLGALADRHRRRPLLLAGNLALAPLVASLCLAGSRLWYVLGVLFLYGALGAVLDAAETALVATALDGALLGAMNGLRTAAGEGTKLLAPLAGAALYTAFGIRAVALLDAASFLLTAWLVLLLRVRESPPPRTGDRLARTLAGARHLRHTAALRPLVLAAGATLGLAGLNGALLFAVVDRGLGRPATFAGMLYAAQGAGSVLCGLASGALLRRCGERGLAVLGIGVFAVAVALRALPYAPLAVGCSLLIGAGLPCVLIAAFTAVQRGTPPALLGRVAATASTVVFVPNALALGLGSGLVAVADHRLLLGLAGAAGLLCAGALARTGAGSRTGGSGGRRPPGRPENISPG
ncbi:MFS transporter [Streptomyces physcomitrii]|uniref:MFS transporter n=1 Tax=Streptomyces physcomitrii TaxID=2724184 RepID=UPI00069627C2